MATMSYVHKPALQPLEHRTLMQLFDIHANNHPDREAFVLYDQTEQRSSYTFKQMQKPSLYLAASFLGLGWKRGQRVVLMIPNRIEFLVSYMALLRIGVNAILVPPAGKRVEEVISMIEQSKCQGIVLCPSQDEPFNNQLNTSLANMMSSSKIVWIDAEHAETAKEKYSYYSDLLQTGEQLDIHDVLVVQNKVQMDDPAVVIFTSGSTGLPKGAQHVHHALVNGATVVGVYGFLFQITQGTDKKLSEADCRIFNDRPFYWGGSQYFGIIPVLTLGCTHVTVSALKSVKESDCDYIMSVLQNERCTDALLMSYVIKDIISNTQPNKYDVSSLKGTVMTGGQPFQPSTFEDIRKIIPHCKYVETYGLVETQVIVATLHLGPKDTVSNDDGIYILPNVEVKIVDEDAKLVPVGHVGEICARSPFTMIGYLENEDATSRTMSRTGWVNTGDLGCMNERGRVKICGRRSNMIKRATVKIFPAEVEKGLNEFPEVHEVVVVGVPDVRLYEELCACVIPQKGSTLETDVSEFEEWISHQWTPDEQGLTLKPKYLVIMEKFVKTKTGKTDRKALKVIAARKLGIELN